MRKPGEREDLPAVRVPGNLQRNARVIRNFQSAGHMGEQDTRAAAIQADGFQNRSKRLRAGRFTVMDAEELQIYENQLFTVEDANAGATHGSQVFGAV